MTVRKIHDAYGGGCTRTLQTFTIWNPVVNCMSVAAHTIHRKDVHNTLHIVYTLKPLCVRDIIMTTEQRT